MKWKRPMKYKILFRIRVIKWYLMHLGYKIKKYNHKLIWSCKLMKCLICRKDLRDDHN